MEEFIKELSKEALALLKKKELLNVAKHYKIEARKAELKKFIFEYLIEEDFINSNGEISETVNAVEL